MILEKKIHHLDLTLEVSFYNCNKYFPESY